MYFGNHNYKKRQQLQFKIVIIPHHCIEEDDRIVYDVSCKRDTGLSLIDIELLENRLQNDLFTTVIRVRRHRVATYADIRKMLDRFKLAREQWNFQRT